MSEFSVRTVDNEYIPMSDGVRLSSRLWLPETETPVPAILEYIPYRKNDGKAERDSMIHPYFAANGYAAVRVDLRGSGESEGILEDEYLVQELKDGEEVLRWIADQPWCDGNVGMMGISWGGFNSLQLAARQPKELKAIIPVCYTDDRYADDIHYMGGCHLLANLAWSSVMFALGTLPPDPRIAGDSWKSMWLERLDNLEPWLRTWLSHQLRDDFWKHGSVCEDYSDIRIPVFAVSGFEDGYTNAVFRLLENIDVPKKGWVGPWQHHYPHFAPPAPQAGFLQEAVRFWDRWLKGVENGVENDPVLSVWHGDPVHPVHDEEPRPGRWLAFDSWPHASIEAEEWQLRPATLAPAAAPAATPGTTAPPSGPIRDGEEDWVTVPGAVETGFSAGDWYGYIFPKDRPGDQRQDDGSAARFRSSALKEEFSIVGMPELHLTFKTDRPSAMVAVRLGDVQPDGTIERLTYGLLNLNHDENHETNTPLEPGKTYHVRVPMNYMARRLTPGHAISLAISSSYWPLAWPSPEPATLSVDAARSRLLLPVFRGSIAEYETQLPEAYVPTPIRVTQRTEGSSSRRVIHDQVTKESRLELDSASGEKRFEDIDLTFSATSSERYETSRTDYYAARASVEDTRRMKRGEWSVFTRTKTALSADRDFYYIHAELEAFDGEERVVSRTWDERIPRNGV